MCSVRSDWLECPGEKWFRRWRRREGGRRYHIRKDCYQLPVRNWLHMCGSVARSHVKSTPPPPATQPNKNLITKQNRRRSLMAIDGVRLNITGVHEFLLAYAIHERLSVDWHGFRQTVFFPPCSNFISCTRLHECCPCSGKQGLRQLH